MSMLAKQKGGIRMKKKEKAMHASVIALHYNVLTLDMTKHVREGLNTVTIQPPGKFALLWGEV
jgi:hypothetical protein